MIPWTKLIQPSDTPGLDKKAIDFKAMTLRDKLACHDCGLRAVTTERDPSLKPNPAMTRPWNELTEEHRNVFKGRTTRMLVAMATDSVYRVKLPDRFKDPVVMPFSVHRADGATFQVPLLDESQFEQDREQAQIIGYLSDVVAKKMHNDFVQNRIQAGWHRGPRFDPEAKTSPALCPFGDLPERLRNRGISEVRDVFTYANAMGVQFVHDVIQPQLQKTLGPVPEPKRQAPPPVRPARPLPPLPQIPQPDDDPGYGPEL